MPQVNFYESGGHIVVEAINIELKMSGGNKWEKGNWNGTSVAPQGSWTVV